MNPFLTWYRGLPPVLRVLITTIVGIYALFLLVFQWVDVLGLAAMRWLALSPTPAGVLHAPWTLLTHAVTHLGGGIGGFLQVLFNVFILVWVGEEMERMMGSSWLLVAFLFSALGGALASIAYTAAVGVAPGYAAPFVFGANASVLGVMMATATRYPDRQIGLLFIGAVRLLYVVIGLLVLALLLSGPFYFIWEVGGVLAALLFSTAEKRGMDLHSWADVLTGRRGRSRRRTAPRSPRPAARVTRLEPEPVGPRRATQAEVDRILDKISAHGRDALTSEERRILDEYSRR